MYSFAVKYNCIVCVQGFAFLKFWDVYACNVWMNAFCKFQKTKEPFDHIRSVNHPVYTLSSNVVQKLSFWSFSKRIVDKIMWN